MNVELYRIAAIVALWISGAIAGFLARHYGPALRVAVSNFLHRQRERARKAALPCDGTNPRCVYPSHCPKCGSHKDPGDGACRACLEEWGLV